MNINECRIDINDAGECQTGMRAGIMSSGVKVTHLPTGLVAIADCSHSQNKNLKTALAMLESGVSYRRIGKDG